MRRPLCFILLLLLTVSVIFNVYHFASVTETYTVPPACNDEYRYLDEKYVGAISVNYNYADSLVKDYRIKMNSTLERPSGFIITKRLIDEIFQDSSLNSLSLDLIMLEDSLKAIVIGHKTPYTKLERQGDSESVYLVKSFCPKDCAY